MAKRSTVAKHGNGWILAVLMAVAVSGCSGGGSSGASDSTTGAAGSAADSVGSTATAPVSVSGSVGDGPVVGATLEVVDGSGEVLRSVVSSDTADYRLELPVGTQLPVLVRATGGTDLVTGGPLDFPLVGAVLATGKVTVNISPLTTLAVEAARCSVEGLSEAGLDGAWRKIHSQAAFGLDSAAVPDPMNDKVSARNVATLVLANELLGESVRRTVSALELAGIPRSGEEILRQYACDLVDRSDAGDVDSRVIAVFEAAALAARLEGLAGRLEVGGYSATARMDDAIRTIRPDISAASVAELAIPDSAREQTARLVALWLDRLSGPSIVRLADRLRSASTLELPVELDRLLDSRLQRKLQELVADIALAPDSEVAAVTDRRERQADSEAPIVSLSANRTEIAAGEAVTLSWAATGADRCVASGAWQGVIASSGFESITGLTEGVRFGVTCAGLGGTAYREVQVAVTGPTPDSESVTQETETPTENVSETSTDPGAGSGTQPAGSEPGAETAPEGEPAPESSGSTDSEPVGSEPAGSSTEPQAPAPVPTVDLQASASAVASGGSATLRWTARDAAACTASGGWTGARPAAGMETVGPLRASTTFTLSCTGAGGTDVAMISVAVNGSVALRWQPPTQLIDGSPLPGLSGYRIYYGTAAGSYLGYQEIGPEAGSEYSLRLPAGEYYIAMTAIGLDGAESAHSNEVRKIVD